VWADEKGVRELRSRNKNGRSRGNSGLDRENMMCREGMPSGLEMDGDLMGRDIAIVGVADLNSLMDVMVGMARKRNYLDANVKMEKVVEGNLSNAASETAVDLAFELLYLRQGGDGLAYAMSERSVLVHTSFFRTVSRLSVVKTVSRYSLW